MLEGKALEDVITLIRRGTYTLALGFLLLSFGSSVLVALERMTSHGTIPFEVPIERSTTEIRDANGPVAGGYGRLIFWNFKPLPFGKQLHIVSIDLILQSKCLFNAIKLHKTRHHSRILINCLLDRFDLLEGIGHVFGDFEKAHVHAGVLFFVFAQEVLEVSVNSVQEGIDFRQVGPH